jgi:density-regulated protein
VRAAEEGKHQDCVDIQGNVEDALAEMLVTKYSIPKTAVYRMEGKKKVPYPY